MAAALALPAPFYDGRVAPNTPMDSPQTIEFYQEQVIRCFEGLRVRKGGKEIRITGDHYYLLNFFPILLNLPDGKGGVEESFDYALFSQEDDWWYKQVEEAEQSHMGVMTMTGRGFGKTYNAISIGGKTYQLIENSHSIISASLDDHADETFLKFKRCLDEGERRHPVMAKKRLNNDEKFIQAGEVKLFEGERKPLMGSLVEKIIYANNAGKTRGRRLNYQHFEEIGDWAGAATLKKCISGSEGTWKVGANYKCRVFYTGTGGAVKTRQAEEIFHNPTAYNIYPVTCYTGKKTAIFFDCTQKCGGFWEKKGDVVINGQVLGHVEEAGKSDREGARAYHEAERLKKEGDPEGLEKYSQEFPFTLEEMFRQSGKAVFPRAQLAYHLTRLKAGAYAKPEYGNMHWRKTPEGEKYVEFEADPNGLIWVAPGGHPLKNEHGVPRLIVNQYIAGLDSIDQSDEDSIVEDGSKLGLLVKRRQGGMSTEGSNRYVCGYLDRPQVIDDAFDNVLKILWYYGCRVNLEHSKLFIKRFLKERGELWRLLERPKSALQSEESQKAVASGKELLGTQMTKPMNVLGINLIKEYLREFLLELSCEQVIEQLLGYNQAEKTKFEYVEAMQLTEIADEDMLELIPREVKKKTAPTSRGVGYYHDAKGIKRWGPLPGKAAEPIHQPKPSVPVDYYSADNQPMYLQRDRYGKPILPGADSP